MASKGFHVDFIGLGAPKCGTTSVAQYLAEHPSISLYPTKELNFFSSENSIHEPENTAYDDGGMTLYEQRFIDAGIDFSKVVGEFSTCYFHDKKAAERIKRHFPKAKLIIMLRNHPDQLFSFYKMDRYFYNSMDCSFEEALKRYPAYIERAKYSKHLRMYFKLFPKKQIKVLLFDDLRKDPRKLMRDLYTFLGVNPNFAPPSLGKAANVAKQARSPGFRNAVIKLAKTAQRVEQSKAGFVIRGLRKAGVDRLLLKAHHEWNVEPSNAPPMKPATRARLTKLFAKDTAATAKLIKRDLAWKNTTPAASAKKRRTRRRPARRS